MGVDDQDYSSGHAQCKEGLFGASKIMFGVSRACFSRSLRRRRIGARLQYNIKQHRHSNAHRVS